MLKMNDIEKIIKKKYKKVAKNDTQYGKSTYLCNVLISN